MQLNTFDLDKIIHRREGLVEFRKNGARKFSEQSTKLPSADQGECGLNISEKSSGKPVQNLDCGSGSLQFGATRDDRRGLWQSEESYDC